MTVRVELGERSYDVRIGAGLLFDAGALIAPLLARPRVAVLTDEVVERLHWPAFRDALGRAGIEAEVLALPAGEGTKSWPHLAHAVEWLLQARVERRDVVVALGGGVIGDLAGFAAAILRRGVRFVQVPTTLLAQVDSSVGGKTGINTAQGKNLVGAFHQPSLVIADTALLATLPERDFLSGYGEVVKYGLLGDAAFFERLEREGPGAQARPRGAGPRRHAVLRDEGRDRRARRDGGGRPRAPQPRPHLRARARGRDGLRDRLLHGEAVAVSSVSPSTSARARALLPGGAGRVRAHLRAMGMGCLARRRAGELPGATARSSTSAHLRARARGRDGLRRQALHGEAVAVGWVSPSTCARLGALLPGGAGACGRTARDGDACSLATCRGVAGARGLMALMGQDKKAVGGRLRFVLARGIGRAFVSGDVAPEAVLGVLRTRG
jgi:3-dehydroquinate synthase